MFIIRLLSIEDCHNTSGRIQQLLGQLSDSQVEFAEVMAAQNIYHVGAYHEDELVGLVMGTCMVGWFGKRLYLDGVVVDSRYRRQGCLTLMITFVEDMARELGCTSISFTSSRVGAVEAYKVLGYESNTTAFRKKL
jgi:GNAT superfamily N-acetyltransferase